MSVLITEHVLQPYEIAPVVANIEEAIGGASREVAIISMLSMILIMTHPEITQDQLTAGVKDVSRYICLVLDPPEPGMMN